MKKNIVSLLIIVGLSSCYQFNTNKEKKHSNKMCSYLMKNMHKFYKLKTPLNNFKKIKCNGFAYFKDEKYNSIIFKKFKNGTFTGVYYELVKDSNNNFNIFFNMNSRKNKFYDEKVDPNLYQTEINFYLPNDKLVAKVTYSGDIYLMDKNFKLHLLKSFDKNYKAIFYFGKKALPIITKRLLELNKILKNNGEVCYSNQFLNKLKLKRKRITTKPLTE